MKIAIIHDEIHMLVKEVAKKLQEKKVEVHLLPWSGFTYHCNNGVIEIMNGKQNLLSFDKVFLDRAGEESSSYFTQLRLFKIAKSIGCLIFNDPYAYELARDKASSLLCLSKNLLPIPPTIVAHTVEDMCEFAAIHKNVICKPIMGHSGIGVFPFSEKNFPFEQLQKLLMKDGILLLQKYIGNDHLRDIRIDIVNGEIVQCYYRYANLNSQIYSGFVICNVSQGGKLVFSNLPQEVRNLAISAARCLNLTVAGVDLLESKDGNFFISEINPEPDISGIEELPFAKQIAHFLVS